jgi:hypothetical protein
MDGKIADMVFCDPPYNVRINDIIGLGSVHHDEFQMAGGEMSEQEFIDTISLFIGGSTVLDNIIS